MAHGVGSQVGQVKLVNKGKVTGMENTLFRLGCRQIDLDVGRELGMHSVHMNWWRA